MNENCLTTHCTFFPCNKEKCIHKEDKCEYFDSVCNPCGVECNGLPCPTQENWNRMDRKDDWRP